MRKFGGYTSFLISAALLLFSGCAVEAEQNTTPVPTIEANQSFALTDATVMEAISFLNEHMQTGMTADEVDKLTGCQSIEVIRALDGKIAYRYDILKSDNYVFEDTEPLYDNIDIEGLKENTISLIMFISFDDGGTRLLSYSLHYYDDGEVRDFYSNH